MRVGINASFLRKQSTGLGQVSANFLKKLAEFPNEEMEFFLYLEEDAYLNLPGNFKKKIFLPKYRRDDLFRRILWEKYLLPKKVKEDKCDVFLSLYQSATILPKKTKHIMIVHDIIPKLFSQYLNNLRKKIYQGLVNKAIKKANKIIAVSHRTEKDLIQYLKVDPKKITVSYVDVDDIFKQRVSDHENQVIMRKYNLEPGYIYNGGGLEMRKNVANILQAYRNISNKHARADWLPKLVISGKMMPELAPLVTDVEKLRETLYLHKQVVLLGHVPQQDLPVLYENASVFIYPSLYEGFGLPILEAMNQGTPVITSKVSSLPEVGSDAVLYCDPYKVEDIEMVIKNVLNNNHLKAALSMKGRERATHFSWDRFIEKIINIVKELK